MMLNLIDAFGGFENPVSQLVIVGITGVAAAAGAGLPKRAVRSARQVERALPA